MISVQVSVYVVTCLSLWASLLLDRALLTESQFYLLEDKQRNYTEAVLKCKSVGYDGLAVVDTQSLLETVLTQLQFPGHEQYWIGMHYSLKKRRHIWDTGVDVTWAAWTPGEPNDLPQDMCVRIMPVLTFGTFNCTANFMAVCGHYIAVYNDLFLETPGHSITISEPLWSGWTRSLLDCIANCAADFRCQHSIYKSTTLTCVTLSKSLDESNSGSQQMLNGVLFTKDDVNHL